MSASFPTKDRVMKRKDLLEDQTPYDYQPVKQKSQKMVLANILLNQHIEKIF